jgi:hypothetical protein
VGYWKNHPEAWCVNEIQLGSHTYTKEEALEILNEPVNGNGLVALAHQLIATKLNLICQNADTSCIQQTVNDADQIIDGLIIPPIGNGFLQPSAVSNLVMMLTQYNEGLMCAPHCATDDIEPPWSNPWRP